MKANVTLDIDGTTFNTDADGWVFDDWSGWLGGAPVNVIQNNRSGHGVTAGKGTRGARLLWVRGWRAGDRASLATAIEELEELLADGSTGVFLAHDIDLGDRWATVQLTGTIDPDWSKPDIVEFQINLLAADPFKYGETDQASTGFGETPEGAGFEWPAFPDGVAEWGPLGTQGYVTIRNAGNAPSAVRFTVDGPTPPGGFRIIHGGTGGTLTFLSVVPANSQLVIDGATGEALLDGVADRSGDLVVQAWPEVPKKSEATFTFEPLAGTSAAKLTAETTATYW